MCIAVGLSAAVRVACEKNGGARGSGTILSMLLSVIPFGGPPCSDPFRSFIPGRLLQTSHNVRYLKSTEKRKPERAGTGGMGPATDTIFLSPERWRSLIAVLGAHKLTAFVKVFQVYRVQVWLRGRSPTPGRRGDIGASRRRTRSGLATRAHQRRCVTYEGCASAARLQAGRKVRGGVSEDSRSYEVLPGEFG